MHSAGQALTPRLGSRRLTSTSALQAGCALAAAMKLCARPFRAAGPCRLSDGRCGQGAARPGGRAPSVDQHWARGSAARHMLLLAGCIRPLQCLHRCSAWRLRWAAVQPVCTLADSALCGCCSAELGMQPQCTAGSHRSDATRCTQHAHRRCSRVSNRLLFQRDCAGGVAGWALHWSLFSSSSGLSLQQRHTPAACAE